MNKIPFEQKFWYLRSHIYYQRNSTTRQLDPEQIPVSAAVVDFSHELGGKAAIHSRRALLGTGFWPWQSFQPGFRPVEMFVCRQKTWCARTAVSNRAIRLPGRPRKTWISQKIPDDTGMSPRAYWDAANRRGHGRGTLRSLKTMRWWWRWQRH